MKTLEKTMGTIDVSQRAAIIMAIKENDDVEYFFNGERHVVTLSEAKKQIYKILEQSFKNRESITANFFMHINENTKFLKEELEAIKILTNPSSIKMILNTTKEVIFERGDPNERWFDNKYSNEALLKHCNREGDTIQRVQWEDGEHLASLLHIYFK